MNALQSAKFKMYGIVENVGAENAGIYAHVAAVRRAFEELTEIIAEISQAAQKKSEVFTGAAADKRNSKAVLCQKTARFAGVVYAYGARVNDYTLMAEMDWSFSKLMRMSGATIAPRCQYILDRGAALAGNLGDYGIDQARIDDLQAAIDDFSAVSVSPRLAAASRSVYVARLVELFKRADALLYNKLDKLIDSFDDEHPEFVAQYKAARIIIDPPRRRTQLKVSVKNKTGKSPIEAATVTILETASTAQTDADGKALFKPIPKGKYTVQITAEGFADFQVENVLVKQGAINRLNAELTEAEARA